ncbi:hypothetical protein C3L33_06737, partial [Rhododendron williamsianum]
MVFRRAVMALLGCLGIAYKTTKPSPAPPESTEPPPPPPPPHQSSSSSSSKPSSSLSSSPSDGDDVGVVGESRIRLRDGRFLAYTERGVPKNKSKFRVIIVHGFGSSKEMSFLAPQEIMDELGVHLVLFDRAGYGESDPNPKRSLESEATDIQELADKLELGSKLAGVAMVVPTINYNWPSLPGDLTKDDFRKSLTQWALRAARYTPGLNKLQQQGVFDSLRRDFIAAFGKWDFDPLELVNPFPKNESSVHIWQGYEDKVVPFPLQRYVSSKLPWIRYHEVPDGGHLLVYDSDVCEAILRSLLLGEDPPLYRPKLS